MVEFSKKVKLLKEQTGPEKIYVLKQMAHHMLGAKWKYYHKIKRGGEGLSLFKEKSLMEQMKATQSALRFTSKSAKTTYRSAYQSSLNDIISNTGLSKDSFPQLPEAEAGKEPPSLTSQFDEVIISWTPIKFFLPARKIREKGKATQRHTEGLIAKLFFKAAAYYAAPENWNPLRLSLYTRKIDDDTSYQDVVALLEPLKKDLEQFVETFEPFKFGQAILQKDASQETDTFDDAMAVESFESQVRTLYWYNFIYFAIEAFVFRYYLVLITSCRSTVAIKYLAGIFEPVFEKVIDNKSAFLGSFEIDRSKKVYREPFEKYRQKRLTDPRSSKFKTRQGIFETYVFNSNLIDISTIGFELQAVPGKDSEWASVIAQYFFLEFRDIENKRLPAEVDELLEDSSLPQQSLEVREYAYMQLLASIVKCTALSRKARHNILEKFKKRVVADKEFAEKQILEMKKKGEKKLHKLERKAEKIKRLKQVEAAEVFEKDIAQFRKRLEDRSNAIRQNAHRELNAQKERLQLLFKRISKEDSVSAGMTANFLHKLVVDLDTEGDFIADFLKYCIENVQNEYSKELEPFYENIFDVLKPSTQEKIIIIQALKKSGGDKSINLTLTQEEKSEFDSTITKMKLAIEKGMPDILKSKIVFLSLACPVEDLFRISIDNKSLKTLLLTKVSLPNTGKQVKIPGETAKSMLILNKIMNPVPSNNLIIEGKESESDPQKAVNSALLNKLLAELP